MKELTFDDIDRLTRGRLGIRDVPCPLCAPFRKAQNQGQPKLRIWRTEPNFASFNCCHCGEHGFVHRHGAHPIEPKELDKLKAEITAREALRREVVAVIWKGILSDTVDLAGTLGEKYLRETRKIDLHPWPDVLRFHPNTKHGPSGLWFPAIVAPVVDARGEAKGIWRIYIDPKTADKAPVESPRLGLGSIKGGAVRLTPLEPDEELLLGEGIETCLAVMRLDPKRKVWAGLSTSTMKAIELPPEIQKVKLLQENDKPDPQGRRASPDAMQILGERLEEEGRKVLITAPPARFKDFNDALIYMRRYQ